MKKLLTTMAALAILGLVAPAMAQWTPLADNPAWWPYGDYPLGVGGGPSPSLSSLGLTAYSAEPNYNTAGYWPTNNAAGVFANDRYYVIGGWGPASITIDPNDPNSAKYWDNRQSQFGIYEPVANSWSSAKYDGTGPTGYNNASGGAMPVVGQGTYTGTEQGVAVNMDGDATLEILVHGGYPRWGGAFDVYDPDTDTWSSTAPSLAFPSFGTIAGYRGSVEEVGGLIYCVGGIYWGPTGQFNYAVYDPSTDTWLDPDPGDPTKYAPGHEDILPGYTDYNGFGSAVVGTDIFLLGGSGGSNQILKFDTTTNTLTDTGSTLLVGVDRPAAVSWGGLVFVLGGRNGNSPSNNVSYTQIYDPSTGTVTMGVPLPVRMSRASADIAPDGTIYLGGCLETIGSDGTTFIVDSNLWSVHASQLIPEPGTMALFGFGLLALLGLRRRK